MKKLFLYSLPFAASATLLVCLPLGEKPRIFNYEHILLQVCINIAIFAINFSFLQYQFAPYRALQRRISASHIWTSITVLVLALIPLVGIILAGPSLSAKLMLGIVPLEMALGIGLCLAVDHLSSPSSILRQQADEKSLDRFASEYSVAIQNRLNEDKKLEVFKPTGMPDFEWSMYPLPELHEEDPFQMMTSLGIAAINNNDLAVFEKTIKAMAGGVAYIDGKTAGESKVGDSHRVKSILSSVCYGSIRRVADAVLEHPNRDAFADRLGRVLSDLILKEAVRGNQTKDLAGKYMKTLEWITLRLLRKGSQSTALLTLKTARQAAQKGLDIPNEADFFFSTSIPSFADVIKRVGQEAIAISDSDLSYRCFDALGWLGCSAVKKKHEEMTRAILQAMVQLGREVRQSKMECFYQRCAIMPFDHLLTRMEWMASWVCSMEGDISPWTRMFATAYSRLHGIEYGVEIDLSKRTFLLINKEKPYQESHTSHEHHSRVVDYSDPTMLKDMVLY